MGFKLKAPKIKFDKKSLSNIGKNTFGYVGQQIGGIPGQIAGGKTFDAYFGSGPKAPSAGEDPNVTALRNRLFGEAQQFEQDLPGLQKQAASQIESEGDLALQSGIKGTQRDFNRRGLLYSGLREAGEQGVRGRVASTMASQKAQSNQDLMKMAQAKSVKAAQVGLQGYQNAVQREAEIAGINLQNQVARAQVMQQLGQTGGYLAGSFYNRIPSAPSTPAPTTYSSNNYNLYDPYSVA